MIRNDEIHKVTIFLFLEDIERMEAIYGYGWSAQIRLILRDFLKRRDAYSDQLRGVANEQ